MEENNSCPVCKNLIQINWNFCPSCGKVLREIAPSTSFSKQLVIYFVSFFLPPFGLSYSFKYLKRKETKVRLVGIISVLLTLISIGLTIISFKAIMDQYAVLLNNLGSGEFR